jgi:hypothetical protein
MAEAHSPPSNQAVGRRRAVSHEHQYKINAFFIGIVKAISAFMAVGHALARSHGACLWRSC